MQKMRVAMYYSNTDVKLEDMPVPKINQGELLVKVVSSGICGSDVMEWYRLDKVPLVLGHEIAGEVTEVGEGVKGFKKGDRIFATHHVPCEKCEYCKQGHETVCDTLHKTNFEPGGFAEFVRIPKINVTKGTFLLPETMSYDEGTFIEPLGCIVRGQKLLGIEPGQTVLVLGSGIAGLLHVKLALAKGAQVFATDLSDYRLKAAEKAGASVIDAKEDVPAKIQELNGKVDRVIVCTGALPAIKQAFESIDKGGKILFFAPTKPGVDVPFPLEKLWKKEISLITSYAASPDDLREAMGLIETKKVEVKDMITHRFPLEKTGEGFKLVVEASDSLKVIIEPQK